MITKFKVGDKVRRKQPALDKTWATYVAEYSGGMYARDVFTVSDASDRSVYLKEIVTKAGKPIRWFAGNFELVVAMDSSACERLEEEV